MNPFSYSSYIFNGNNLLRNINFLKSKLNKGVEFCAVVKADAYGVGLEKVAGFIKNDVDLFAVANLEEAIRLRKSGILNKILVLGCSDFNYICEFQKYKITPTVNSNFDLNKLSRMIKTPIEVEFGLNSGMNRFGFSKKTEILRAIALLKNNPKIRLCGVYSHLATKEDDAQFIQVQKNKFNTLCDLINIKGVKKHLSNSNGILHHPEVNYDRVRCGFALYGMDGESDNLLPVVGIESKIVFINEVKRGETIGYDRTFISPRKTRYAVIPLGYYDGINRRVSNKGRVLINGCYAPIIGRVCMDVMMVDITNIKEASVGTKVTIIGTDGNKSVTIKDYAKWSGTSCYETFLRFNRLRMREVNIY